MTIENIERIIELLPKNILGSNNKTRHFFYGNGNSLNDIKRNIDDANIIFDDKNDVLIVEINTSFLSSTKTIYGSCIKNLKNYLPY